MEKIFQNGIVEHKRPIKIKIDNDWITFMFVNEADREFYDIPKEDWASQKECSEYGWQEHMMQKSWFSKEMADFINKNIK
jgi:hypothetical protein